MTGGPIRFNLTGDDAVAEVFANAPRTAYRHLREYVFKSFLDHRKRWLRAKGTKFGRGGRGVKVFRVGEEGPTTEKSVHYDVPKDRRAKSTSDAIGKLQRFRAEVRTGSLVLEVHQKGAKISSSNELMPIAIKTRPGDPRQWRARNPGKRLRFLPRRGGGYSVFEETGKRKKRLRLRWVYVRKVRNKPVLKFYETWEALRRVRDLQWRDTTTRMVIDMENGRG